MFIDKATIRVQAGAGGNGAVSFHREKFVAAGGPDGGDGGRGGNVVLQGCQHINTLVDFQYKRKFVAQNGQNGSGNRCYGKSAPDLIIKVPVGTVFLGVATAEGVYDIPLHLTGNRARIRTLTMKNALNALRLEAEKGTQADC